LEISLSLRLFYISIKGVFMKNTKNKCAKMQSVLATQIRSICAIAIVAVIGFSMAACSSGDDGVTPNPDDGKTKPNPDDGTKTPVTFAITMQNDNGIATANPNPAKQGEEVTITATANSGYRFVNWEVVSGGLTLSHNTASPADFTMPGNAVTIKANFALIPVNTPSISFTTVPTFDHVKAGYGAQSAKNITITNNGTAIANVTSIALDNTTGNTAFTLGGTLTPTVAANGGTATFTIQPKTGLSAGTHEGTITVNYNGEPTQAMVSFTVIPTFAITMQNDGNGTATANPNPAAQGEEVTITAIANSGYHFVNWEVVSGGLTLSHNTVNPADFTMPGNAVTIKANFALIPVGTPSISFTTVPTFDHVTFGYGAQSAKNITITNNGTTIANVTSIALDSAGNSAFTLGGTLTPTVAANGGTATFTIQPKTELSTGTHEGIITVTYNGDPTQAEVSFTINKATGATVSAPTLKSTSGQTSNFSSQGSATINAVTAPANGQSVEYGISNTNNAATVNAWQDGLAFNLIVGLVDYHFIFARSKGDNNHLAGAASAGLSVVIPIEVLYPNIFASAFSSLPPNNAATPYTFKANINQFPDLSSVIAFYHVAENYPNHYFSIDLSDSTFTSVPFAGQAFENCKTLTGVILPNSVTSIGQRAFGNTSLTSITIPKSLLSISNTAFSGCTNLIAINVDAGHTAFISQDGILYNTDKSTLVLYPTGKTGSFTIPNGVTSIGNGAFAYSNLTSVTIPNSVTSIVAGAFAYSSLTSITFATGSNIPDANFGNNVSPEGSANGNTLKTAYNAASPKEGTYTRATNGSTWSKQP
jgi:hypothetical protein